jgi:hypothetical protein
MESDTHLEELKKLLKDKNCIIEKHSNVMEITFEREKDANWFEGVFEHYQRESAVCCLMPIRPKNAPPKFIFNIKDMKKFIELMKSG